MTFEEYQKLVREQLSSIAKPDVLDDMNRPSFDPQVKCLFTAGYSVNDAVRSIYLTSDELPEAWAIIEQNKISKKYNVRRNDLLGLRDE